MQIVVVVAQYVLAERYHRFAHNAAAQNDGHEFGLAERLYAVAQCFFAGAVVGAEIGYAER